MIIAIDFDETIMNPRDRAPGFQMGRPEPGAAGTISRWKDEGHTIVIFTARDINRPQAKQVVADWLQYFKIPFNDITNVKGNFDVMIDNRGLHFQSWAQVDRDLRKAQEQWGTWSNHVTEHTPFFSDVTQPIDNQPEV